MTMDKIQSSYLAIVAKTKLLKEAALPEYSLRRLVAHANFLDQFLMRLDAPAQEGTTLAPNSTSIIHHNDLNHPPADITNSKCSDESIAAEDFVGGMELLPCTNHLAGNNVVLEAEQGLRLEDSIADKEIISDEVLKLDQSLTAAREAMIEIEENVADESSNDEVVWTAEDDEVKLIDETALRAPLYVTADSDLERRRELFRSSLSSLFLPPDLDSDSDSDSDDSEDEYELLTPPDVTPPRCKAKADVIVGARLFCVDGRS